MGERRAISASAIVAQIAQGAAGSANIMAFEDLIIEGSLDLSRMRIDFPLTFVRCDFEGELKLRGATIAALMLSGCRLNGFAGAGMKVAADLQLCDAIEVAGSIVLDGARIGGNLSCSGAMLRASGGSALSADEAVVEGHLVMGNGFRATGTVSIRKARIGGMLYCAHGLFDIPGAVAIAPPSGLAPGSARWSGRSGIRRKYAA